MRILRNRASLLQLEVSYDKLCATRKSTMSEHTKNRWQNRRRHEAHDGDISGTFRGRVFKVIRMMELNLGMKTRGGKYCLAKKSKGQKR